MQGDINNILEALKVSNIILKGGRFTLYQVFCYKYEPKYTIQ